MTRFNPRVKLATQSRFAAFIEGAKVYPINVEVSPVHVCQAKCPWCFYAGTHEKLGPESMLERRMALALIQEMAALGVKAVTWTGGGEPTLHPDFEEFVLWANRQGLKQGLFTNGRSRPRYDTTKLEWIRVSNTERDWNVEVLKEIRSGAKVMGLAVNYVGGEEIEQEVTEGTEGEEGIVDSGELVARGWVVKRPEGRAPGDEEVFRALEVGEIVGVDYVQVRQALNLRGYVTERRPPAIEHPLLFVTDYKFDDSANPHGYSECYGFNFVPFIWHDGDVDVCGYHRKKGWPYTLGNLGRASLKEIMDGAPRSVPVCGTCQVCCKNHEANKLVNEGLAVQDGEFV
jgi:MoaA/NifB/PqqE/SkfB family radical SAM enzyme